MNNKAIQKIQLRLLTVNKSFFNMAGQDDTSGNSNTTTTSEVDLTALKKTQATCKGVVTRHLNSLSRHVTDEDGAAVQERLGKLKDSFDRFEEAHNAYHVALINDTEIENSVQYFYEVESKYIDIVTKAKGWLRAVGVTPNRVSSSDSSQVNSIYGADVSSTGGTNKISPGELTNLINLPKLDFQKFSGDPLEYHTFITIFEESVKAVKDKKSKLTRLLQCTSGKARDSIKSCILMAEGEGYDAARKVLHRRFGDSHLVTETIIQGLREGKSLKTSEDLLKFSDELKHGYMILTQMNREYGVESQRCIVELADRLQGYLRNKWRKRALEIKEQTSRYPFFHQFVEFVSKEAQAAADPVYGTSKQGQASSHVNTSFSSKGNPKKGHTFATSSDSKKFNCVLCNNDHRLYYCPNFKSMKPTERLEVVSRNKLCENCLLGNHTTANCRRCAMCSVPGCGKRHSKFIHINKDINQGGNSQNNDADSSVRVVNASVSTPSNVHMPFVAVRVNAGYETCALLDTASSNTFCSQTLVDALKLRCSNFLFSEYTKHA